MHPELTRVQKLQKLLRSLGLSVEDSEDLASELWLIEWKAGGSLNENFVKMVGLGFLRRKNKRKFFELIEDLDLVTVQEEKSFPELYGLLEKIPFTESKIIFLKFWEKLSFEEIATETNLQPQNVKLKLYSVLDSLRTKLNELNGL